LVGVDAPVANALRRILLSEVPSVAIETVYINQNTSIIQDEVLSHRLGLVPLRVDPRQMDASLPGDEPTDLNTIVYKLCVRGLPEHARYSKEELAALDNTGDDVEGRYTKVYSRDMQWQPQGTQEERFAAPADPVQGDIWIAKLAPGQVIELEAHAVKSIGKDHAKFSPVCTASYRLLPAVTLSGEQPFVGDEARQLVAACPLGVFDIEDVGASRRAAAAGDPPRARARCGRLGGAPLLAAAVQRAAGRQCTRCCGALGARACAPPARARARSLARALHSPPPASGVAPSPPRATARAAGQARAVVARPRDCNLCRECIRRPEWVDRVSLERVADHFICECVRRSRPRLSPWCPAGGGRAHVPSDDHSVFLKPPCGGFMPTNSCFYDYWHLTEPERAATRSQPAARAVLLPRRVRVHSQRRLPRARPHSACPPAPPRPPVARPPAAVTIESTGAMSAADLFREALRLLADKARALSAALETALATDTGGVMPAAQAAKHTLAAMTLEPDDLS
jgi:DNA-directed RNA polymerase I and III subunit RPAC1